MVRPRSESGLRLMRESGKITASALRKALGSIRFGISGIELNKIAEDEIKNLGGHLSFTTVKGYKWASCISINEQIVHGIPTERKVQEGDIVSIDLGTLYKGWHTDAAWTIQAKSEKARLPDGQGKGKSEEQERFLKTGEEALWLGIKQAVEGNTIGDISAAIQDKVEGARYSVVRALVGHGVGKNLHEEPEVPGYGKKGTGLVLQKGITLAIEVIYTMGKPEVVLEKDGWTVSSADGSLSGLFEMTVVVGSKKAEVLTYNL